MLTVYLQEHAIRLKAWHDLSSLSRYGRVFRVFDQLISGNLCCGVENEQGRFFIKYAGAPTINYIGSPKEAVARLKQATHIYHELMHPLVPPLLHVEETAQGILCIFPWKDGYPLGPLNENYQLMRTLPIHARYAMLDNLFSYLVMISSKDYLPAGLADNHFLFDMDRQQLTLCSVDDFIKMPHINVRGRLPGAPWYIAPEGYKATASLDEGITVYAMGALAMTFLGDRHSFSKKYWESSSGLHQVALRALQEDKKNRQPSAEAFLNDWRQEILRIPFI